MALSLFPPLTTAKKRICDATAVTVITTEILQKNLQFWAYECCAWQFIIMFLLISINLLVERLKNNKLTSRLGSL